MKFNFILILIFLYSCAVNTTKLENRAPFNSKGFAFVIPEEEDKNSVIKSGLDNTKFQISQQDLKINTLIKIINPKTQEYLTLPNTKKIDYPDFYKILITKKIAEKINLNTELPLVEIIEIKKNKSFKAKKAKIYNEEKKISSNAPVTSVQISNISKNKQFNKVSKKEDFFILIGTFYSEEIAKFLKDRINKEIPNYDIKKLKIAKKSNKEIRLMSGPYNTINFMKKDYILLKAFGFEDLDITNE